MTRQRSVLLDHLTALAGADPSFLVGTVVTVAAGGASDGNALVTVEWAGTQFKAPYAASYTPVVGHVVVMARTQPPFIIARVIGTPPA